VPYLEAELLRTLRELREVKPDHYLIMLVTNALNGELVRVEHPPEQMELDLVPSFLREQAE
jgi:hypothetical protein